MEKRAVIAVVLSGVVFYIFSALFPQQRPVTKPVQGQMTARAATVGAAPAAAPAPLVAIPSADASARDITVETPLYSAVFSTAGGGLKKFVLKKYHEDIADKGNLVKLIDEQDPAASSLRLAATNLPLPPVVIYSADKPSLTVDAGSQGKLVLSFQSPQGLRVDREFTFDGSDYSIRMQNRLTNTSAAALSGTVQVVETHRYDLKNTQGRFEGAGPVAFGEKLLTETTKKVVEKGFSHAAPVQWAGFADKYFLQAVTATNANIASFQVTSNPAGLMENRLNAPAVTIQPGQSVTLAYGVYLGPKDLDILKRQGSNLERAIDLGWFSALAKPLLNILKYFHKYTGNYGVAIIIITVILKVLFFPLTYKSYKSMKEMQVLQPKMNKIRDKFKNDREAMNREIMKLYQEHKVNPLGGCLPMIVQIPVFFALYKALMFSIELRHAPFYLWIADLSTKDPYYVTPVIMGVTMFIQQKMTPSNMDPMQAKMMLALPVVFTFMFLSFPSGLVLYWLVNNVLTILQQWYINNSLKEMGA